MAEEKGFLEKILGENIADKIDRGFVNLLGGGNLLGPSLSDYDDAVQQLEEMGMSAEDIIDMLGPRPETREERLNQKFKADGGRVNMQTGGAASYEDILARIQQTYPTDSQQTIARPGPQAEALQSVFGLSLIHI